MQWFRFYHDALDDPKVQRLDPPAFKAWVNLLCLASRSEPRGMLPPISDIAFALRLSEEVAATIVQQLTDGGLLDKSPKGLRVHNWSKWQQRSDDGSARVRKYRASQNNGLIQPETLPKRSRNAPEQSRGETEQKRGDSDTDGEREEPPALSIDDFSPTETDMEVIASEVGLTFPDLVYETEKFRDYYAAHGKVMDDWAAAWRSWMRKVPDFYV